MADPVRNDPRRAAEGELSEWRGWRRFDRMVVRYAILAIAVLVIVLVTFDRIEYLNSQYRLYQRTRLDIRTLLQLQLDEETGIRGYAATLSPPFLEPYQTARPQLIALLVRLSPSFDPDRPDGLALADFARQHSRWEGMVAVPIAKDPRSPDNAARERLGRAFVDRMRADVWAIDAWYARLGADAGNQARILEYLCAGLIVALIALAGLIAYVSERRSARHEERLLVDLVENRDSATRLSDWRSKVVAMLAHDFKSTLGVISAYVGLLEDFPERRGDPQIYRGMEGAVKELAAMADEALLMARVAAGNLKIALAPQDLAGILDEIARRYSGRREVRLDRANGDLFVRGDRAYLLRAFDNIVGNAIKYSPEETPVDVRAGRNAAGDAVVTVRDRGRGIDPEDVPHVFEAYWRSSTASSEGGTGVGLFVVKKIVDAHHGTVAVQSPLGEGTTVTVTLPAAR